MTHRLQTLIRPERSFERFSGGAALVLAIKAQQDGEHNPHAERIMDAFDLNIIEWHYWRKIAEGA
tara:strand:+ start:6338 stop:6532 length:195 start_codon:yes stop_codon:yes gene_type:complete